MKPPKCKSCGAEEWRHTCGPALTIDEKVALRAHRPISTPFLEKMKPKPVATPRLGGYDPITPARVFAEPGPEVAAKPKPDRKEYLKLKARERRARQKAERVGK
jgi:hypothetical protein